MKIDSEKKLRHCRRGQELSTLNSFLCPSFISNFHFSGSIWVPRFKQGKWKLSMDLAVGLPARVCLGLMSKTRVDPLEASTLACLMGNASKLARLSLESRLPYSYGTARHRAHRIKTSYFSIFANEN